MTIFEAVFVRLRDKRQVVLFGVTVREVPGLFSSVFGSLVLERIILTSLVNVLNALLPYSSVIALNNVFLVLSSSHVHLFSCRA